MSETDPFAVIECAAPEVDDETVDRLLAEAYGLAARRRGLVSERDQNFRLDCEDGRRFVLKIANAAEDPVATDFQIKALLYLEDWLGRNPLPITVPRILRTLDGQSHTRVATPAGEYVVRIVSFLDGMPLGEAAPSALLCRRMGACLAHLGTALRDFKHPGSGHGLLWDMQQALRMRNIVDHVADESLREAVGRALDDFERYALPHFPSLRNQVIHSDFNPDNVLLVPDDPDRVAGVIDFGDMLQAPLACDVAIGASYIRRLTGDPLAGIAEFVAGYHDVTPLERDELDLLYDLVRTRLAASVAILSWRAALRGPDDPYLDGAVASEGDAAAFLARLNEYPREAAQKALRQVAAATLSEPPDGAAA